MTVRATGAALLERDSILDSISSLTARAVDGAGSFVVIEGEAGIGKTAVLDVARQQAAARGMLVLTARGSELEQTHPLGVATSLFGSIERSGGADQLFRGAAAPAHTLFTAPSGEGSSEPMDLRTMVHALYWLTLNASERDPLFIAIDDAHWADEPSLRYVAYLAERISTAPALLAAALRPGAASATTIGEHIRSHRRAERLSLAALSRGGVDALIESTGNHLSGARHEEIWTQAGGNPFYVVELARATAEESEATVPLSGPIQASVRRRLADDGRIGARDAEAIAFLGASADASRVGRLAGTTEAETAEAIRRLTDREILAHDRLDFLHPIIRTTVVEAIPAVVRSQLHREAARALRSSGGSALDIAGHLLHAEPATDESSVEQLREAARGSMAAGDAEGAVRFLRRAVVEPPSADVMGPVLLELAQCETAAGEVAAADRFEAAIAHLHPGEVRARARLAQGLALIQASSWHEAVRAFEHGLADVDPADTELMRKLESGYISSAYVGLTDHAEANRRLTGVLSSPLEDSPSRELAAWSAFQQTLSMAGNAAATDELARRAIEGGISEELVRSSQLVELVAGAFIGCGRLVEDLDMLTEAIEIARQINAHAKVGVYSYCRSIPLYLTGRLREAIADGQTAVSVHEAGWEVFYPGACALLAWAHIERGDIKSAERSVAIDDEVWGQRLDFVFLLRIGRARVAMARGDLQESLAQYELVRAAGDQMGIRSVQLLADWRTGAAVVLRAMDRREDAVRVAEEAIELAEGWGEPIAIGRALQALGIARGGAEGVEHLRSAVRQFEGSPALLDTVRATADLGAALRRDGQIVEAREVLARAADGARRLGAVAIGERAQADLIAAGARPRRSAVTGVESLTPSELRVARMAADGLTNREVAQALFVTPKAVEYHLANAYRKLAIEGRAGLAAAIAQSTTEELASV